MKEKAKSEPDPVPFSHPWSQIAKKKKKSLKKQLEKVSGNTFRMHAESLPL